MQINSIKQTLKDITSLQENTKKNSLQDQNNLHWTSLAFLFFLKGLFTCVTQPWDQTHAYSYLQYQQCFYILASMSLLHSK